VLYQLREVEEDDRCSTVSHLMHYMWELVHHVKYPVYNEQIYVKYLYELLERTRRWWWGNRKREREAQSNAFYAWNCARMSKVTWYWQWRTIFLLSCPQV